MIRAFSETSRGFARDCDTLAPFGPLWIVRDVPSMTTRSFLIGTAFGASCALSRIALQRVFGIAPDAEIPLLITGAAFFSLGFRAAPARAQPQSWVARISLRNALLVFGAWVALGSSFAGSGGRAIAWAGGGIGAGWLALAIARILVAIPLLGPPAWLFGLLIRTGIEALPERQHPPGGGLPGCGSG